MKTSLSFLASLGLVLGSAWTSLGAQVTFQVNMSAQIALGNFNPAVDTVLVAGDPINAWSTTESPLAPSPGNASVYVGTFEVIGAAGATAQYKFLFTTAATTTWEGNVGTGGGTGNRVFTLTDADQSLPVVFFNNVTSGTSVSSDVTFQVDMSVQMTLGNFDPDTGTVSVAGEFNAWSTSEFELARSASHPSLWVGTRKLTGAANAPLLYKFVMNGGTWEGNVGTDGAQNRALLLIEGPRTLAAVFFNNVATVPVIIPVTFRVNLATQIARGEFDPATGTVSVAGDLLNNWDPSVAALTRETADSSVWAGTFEVTTTSGAAMLHKFVLNGSTWEGNVGPDGTQNRTHTFANSEPQNLPVAFFNNASDLGPLSLGPVAAGRLTLSWMAGPLIRLQTTKALRGVAWADIPNTLGQSNAMVALDSREAYFRLVGP